MERSDRAAQRPVRRNYGAAQRLRSARARSASVTAATFVARVSCVRLVQPDGSGALMALAIREWQPCVAGIA